MRAARGTLAAVGLLSERWKTSDRVARLLVEGRCTGECASCARACVGWGEMHESHAWPRVSILRLSGALRAMSDVFDRVEIAAGSGPGTLRELTAAVAAIAASGVPVWAVYPARSSGEVQHLMAAGAVRLVLPVGPAAAGRHGVCAGVSAAEAAEIAQELEQAYPGRVAVREMETGGSADCALADLKRAGIPILTAMSGDE